MRILIALAVLAVTMLMASVAAAQTCDFSGAPVGPSEARMKVRVRDSDGVLRTHYFGGPAHAYYYISDIYGDDPNIHSAFVADYGNDGAMIDANSAWFLVDVDEAPYGTEADPPVVGFASEDAARQWQSRIGGEPVQGWTAVWNWLDEGASRGYAGDRYRHYGREDY